MKKQLIAVGLAGLLTIPAVSFGAEMAGPSLYGSFRTGIIFGSDKSEVSDLYSRWGIQGSHEVSEGLTAAYKYEAKINTANAVSSGLDGRLSYISLSGGFGTVSIGQIWSASANHYYFTIDPSHYNGVTGGASTRISNAVSYSSSAGDVSFQIDKVMTEGEKEKVELGATAALGPVGVGVGYWKSDNDKSSFSGVSLSTGAAGVNLAIGLGSSKNPMTGASSDTTVLKVTGTLGDSGFSYGVQVADSKGNENDQNLIALTNSLGDGASLVFEHLDPGGSGDNTSIIGLRVDF